MCLFKKMVYYLLKVAEMEDKKQVMPYPTIERLALRTKERYINDIIAGKQKIETRDCSPFYTDKIGLLYYVDKGKKDWDCVKYVNTLHLYAGNKPDSKFVDVEVTGTYLTEFSSNPEKGWGGKSSAELEQRGLRCKPIKPHLDDGWDLDEGGLLFEFDLGNIIDHN
jgi:hypothetical protein